MAYFLTFSTYGTHLPGAESGSTDRHQGRLPSGIPELQNYDSRTMAEPAFRLDDPADRQLVLNTIVALCQRRQWRLLALHVRTTHVHGLVQAEGVSPSRVMGDWKANVSQVLKQRWPARERFWTRSGDARSVQGSVDAVLSYILQGQGEPMQTFIAPPEAQPKEPTAIG